MILYVFEVLEEFNGLVPSMASDPALKDQVMFSDGGVARVNRWR